MHLHTNGVINGGSQFEAFSRFCSASQIEVTGLLCRRAGGSLATEVPKINFCNFRFHTDPFPQQLPSAEVHMRSKRFGVKPKIQLLVMCFCHRKFRTQWICSFACEARALHCHRNPKDQTVLQSLIVMCPRLCSMFAFSKFWQVGWQPTVRLEWGIESAELVISCCCPIDNDMLQCTDLPFTRLALWTHIWLVSQMHDSHCDSKEWSHIFCDPLSLERWEQLLWQLWHFQRRRLLRSATESKPRWRRDQRPCSATVMCLKPQNDPFKGFAKISVLFH